MVGTQLYGFQKISAMMEMLKSPAMMNLVFRLSRSIITIPKFTINGANGNVCLSERCRVFQLHDTGNFFFIRISRAVHTVYLS